MLKEGPKEDPRLAPWVGLWAACKQEVKIMAELLVAQAGPERESQPEPNSPHWESSSHTLALSFLFLILGNLSGHWLTTAISEK